MNQKYNPRIFYSLSASGTKPVFFSVTKLFPVDRMICPYAYIYKVKAEQAQKRARGRLEINLAEEKGLARLGKKWNGQEVGDGLTKLKK